MIHAKHNRGSLIPLILQEEEKEQQEFLAACSYYRGLVRIGAMGASTCGILNSYVLASVKF